MNKMNHENVKVIIEMDNEIFKHIPIFNQVIFLFDETYLRGG